MPKVVKPWSHEWLIAAGAYPGFCCHEAARSIYTHPGRDATPSQVTPLQFVSFHQQFAGTHLYSWVETGTVRVRCLAQEHNAMVPVRARTMCMINGVKNTFCHCVSGDHTNLNNKMNI